MKQPSTATVALSILVLLTLAASVWAYPRLPEQISLHLGVGGQATYTVAKETVLAFVPGILAILAILYWVIPMINPISAYVEKFRAGYDALWLVVALFLAYVQGILLVLNLGVARFDLTVAVIPGLAVLWFAIGVILSKAQKNYHAFIGIWTPWTLRSPVVWGRTHAFGGNAFMITAFVLLFWLFSPRASIGYVIVPIVLAILASIVYSYVVWRGLQPDARP